MDFNLMELVIELACIGALVAAVLRVVLIVRPVPGAQLPHPSKIPGMPMAGPASLAAAHLAINRKKS
jgi:hypothetical protein